MAWSVTCSKNIEKAVRRIRGGSICNKMHSFIAPSTNVFGFSIIWVTNNIETVYYTLFYLALQKNKKNKNKFFLLHNNLLVKFSAKKSYILINVLDILFS